MATAENLGVVEADIVLPCQRDRGQRGLSGCSLLGLFARAANERDRRQGYGTSWGSLDERPLG